MMLPALAIVDPALTLALPPALTASTGMDALTQLIEPYVSVKANPLTDAICLEGLPRVARALRRAVLDGNDLAARTTWRSAAYSAGWRWPTRHSARCTGLPRPSADGSPRRTARCARRCCRM